jgi:hypothetical protein
MTKSNYSPQRHARFSTPNGTIASEEKIVGKMKVKRGELISQSLAASGQIYKP